MHTARGDYTAAAAMYCVYGSSEGEDIEFVVKGNLRVLFQLKWNMIWCKLRIIGCRFGGIIGRRN